MREFFDVALIGGGPAAVFAAYEFSLKYPELKVVILEEGHLRVFVEVPGIKSGYSGGRTPH